MGAVCLVLLVVVGGVADTVNMVLLVLMRGVAVTDFASCGGCCAVRGDSVVGGAANILYSCLTERNSGFPYLNLYSVLSNG